MASLSAPANNSPTVQAKKHPALSDRLRNYRLSHDLVYNKLAVLCGVSPPTIVRACAGGKLTERIAYKIEKFLESVGA